MSRESVLVSSEWVASNLNNIVLIEVDEDTAAYEQAHIEGAIRLHWRDELQEKIGRDIISKENFEILLSSKGVSNDDTVVLYGGNNNWFAAYAYWYFKLYGHQDVKLMDGGRKIWELENRPMTDVVPNKPKTSYRATSQNTNLRAFRDEVLLSIGKKNLVDVRSPQEFSGELAAPAHLPQEQGQVKGHIPTAKNIPWAKTANEDGTFKSKEELKDLYASAGIDFNKETIAYCRIGERSSHSWFVLHELLELPNVKNYDGSWTEWGSLVGAPVEVGA